MQSAAAIACNAAGRPDRLAGMLLTCMLDAYERPRQGRGERERTRRRASMVPLGEWSELHGRTSTMRRATSPSSTDWPAARWFALGYAVAIAALLINALVTFWNLNTIRSTWDTLVGDREFVRGIDKVLLDLKDAETGQRLYVLTGEERYLQSYQRSRAITLDSIGRLRILAGQSSSRRRHLDAIARATDIKLADLERMAAIRSQKGLEGAIAAVKSDRGEQDMSRVRSELVALRIEEDSSRQTLRDRLHAAITRTILTFTFASALALGLLFTVHFLSERGRNQLRRHAEWLSTTLRSIGDAVIATDSHGRVSFMNAEAESLTGWMNDDALGQPLDKVFRTDNETTGREVESPVASVLRDGVPVGPLSDMVLTAQDGTRRPIEDSAAPIRDEAGVQGAVLVFRDASAAREAAARIRESEERYRSLVAATTQTVWTMSPEFTLGVIFDGQKFVGSPGEQKSPTGWLETIHPDDRQPTRQAFIEAIKSKGTFEIEHRVRSQDGDYRQCFSRAVPLLDSAGNIREWIGTSDDISERRQADEAREQLYQELRNNDRRKDEFLAMLSHELRNPLAAIGNAVSLSMHSRLQKDIDWSMQVVDRQVKHLARLIDDLLDLSRINSGKIELRRATLEATPILSSAVETMQPVARARQHQVSVELDRGNLWVSADPARLEQVVTNLLTNAVKYTENGGQIWLKAGRDRGDVYITVKDTGIGIPPEKLPEMFELFAQGDRTLARSEGGLGIGLTVVKKLVQMHGGAITARSQGVGKGSEFTVRLPAAKPPEPADAPGAAPTDSETATARILVVDDNVDTTDAMARLLKLQGHDVQTAYNGWQAIKAAQAHSPEFVLLDIGLPGMDGYAVADRLRRDGSCKRAVFVAMTGYGQDEDKHRSQEAGFDYHLVKPVDHDALARLLSQARPNPTRSARKEDRVTTTNQEF